MNRNHDSSPEKIRYPRDIRIRKKHSVYPSWCKVKFSAQERKASFKVYKNGFSYVSLLSPFLPSPCLPTLSLPVSLPPCLSSPFSRLPSPACPHLSPLETLQACRGVVGGLLWVWPTGGIEVDRQDGWDGLQREGWRLTARRRVEYDRQRGGRWLYDLCTSVLNLRSEKMSEKHGGDT